VLDLGILFAQLAAYAGRGFKAPLLLGMGLHNNQLCWHQDPECIYIHTFIHININVGIYSTVHAGTGPPHSLRLPSGERRIDSKKKKKNSTVQYSTYVPTISTRLESGVFSSLSFTITTQLLSRY